MFNGLKFLTYMPWASVLDYPAGSQRWSSGPTKVIPSYGYFTPSVAFAPTAQEMNYMFNFRDQATSDLYALAGQFDGVNWDTFATSTISAYGMMSSAPAWDAFGGRWITMAKPSSGSTFAAYYSYDGKNWLEITTNTLPSNVYPDDIVIDPTNGNLYALIGNAGGTAMGDVYAFNATTNTWAELSGTGGTLVGGSGGTGAAVYFAGASRLVFAITKGATFAMQAGYIASGAMTGPSGTLFTCGASGASFAMFAQSPTTLLLASQSNSANYAYSSDGIAWTAAAFPTLLSGEQCYGVAHDDATNVFFALFSSTTQARPFSSVDGITNWRLCSTIPHRAVGLAANGSLLVSLLQMPNTGDYRGIFAVDGGFTWRYSRLRGVIPTQARFRSNGGQFLFYDNAGAYAASLFVGLPPPVN